MPRPEDIPDHAPDPLKDKPEVWILFDGDEANFRWKENAGEKDYRRATSCNLIVERITLLWDPEGVPARKIPPRWSANLHGQHKRLGRVRVIVGSAEGIKSVAKEMQCVPAPEIVSLLCEPSTDCTFINLYKWDGSAWTPQRGDALPGASKEDRWDSALQILRRHPLFDHASSHAGPFQKGEQPKYGSHKSSDPAPAPAHSAAAPPPGSPSGPRRATVPVPDGFEIFGWKPKSWYGADLVSRPQTDAQAQEFGKLAETQGLSEDESGRIRRHVCRAAGIELEHVDGLACSILVNLFLAGATEEQVSQAHDAEYDREEQSTRSSPPPADEYDPFAEE